MNSVISKAINIIEFILAPTQIIINGPRATFGREFNIVRYGSRVFAKLLKYHIRLAIIKPKIVDIAKLIIVSYSVMAVCINKVLSLISDIIVFITFVGDDDKKELIMLYLDSISHIIRNVTSISS